jgi:hypothetical protein
MTPYLFRRGPFRSRVLAFVISGLGLLLCLRPVASGAAEIASGPAEPPQPHANPLVGQAGFQIFSGNGNHAIDPNECNALNLVLTNSSGATITGIDASFATTDPDVIVTQPSAAFPDLPAGSIRTNSIPFQISTLPSFTAGRTILGTLNITSSNSDSFSLPIALTTGEISPLAIRFDNNAALGILDVGVIESTNLVTGFTGSVSKVVLSLYLTHPSDQALTNLSLIGPDGTTVLLSSGNGGTGQNYGSGTADAARTVFDDSATNPITVGAAPFVGTFRPQAPLSAFSGKTNVNGAWRLHIADGASGSVGSLKAWSLFLYPVTSIDGGGACALCPDGTFLTNYLSATGGVLPQRLYRDSTPSTCGPVKTFPGIITNYSGGFSYQAYPFYNGPSNTCIEVTLTTPAADIMSAAFANTFDPHDPKPTYLADSGVSTAGASAISYSFSVNPDTVFIIVVNNVSEINVTATDTNAGYGYSLSVTGGNCAPRLNIHPAGTNRVDVLWPAVSGDFRLQASPRITQPLWNFVTNEPVANASRFNVTNRSDSPPMQIYRLQSH